MAETKNDAPAVAGQNAPSPETSQNSIPQNVLDYQGITPDDVPGMKKGKRFSKDKAKVLGAHQKVYAVAFKFYEEQLPYGETAFVDAVRNSDKRAAQVMAIKHDRDVVTDGIWACANVKPHWHCIVRMTDRKHTMRVSSILKDLRIVYRQGIDDDLWKGHGVETVGNFAGYAVYLTHDTEQAIKDAKERYDVSEIVSNLSPEEIAQVREGYIRVSERRKVTQDELVALDKEAFDMGYAMQDFDRWYNEQPFAVRSNAKMKTIRESYDRGVKVRVDEHQEINRLCVFIQGEPNTGKTYAAKKALAGKRILSVGGGGTGKFDLLRPDHEAIVIDDDVCPNLLNMTDNYICRAYKRNSNNPAWSGRYFVVTSNMTFREWLEACGIRTQDVHGMPSPHYKAMLSRFFVCRLKADASGVNHLAPRSASTRGSQREQVERADMFMEFKRGFDETIAGYAPGMNHVDFSAIIEPDD
ncbi:Rep family protein [uncultured Alistipes sp.]|jgi:hypothetical protein|uniref:Rep family protein n=1 Tax=uncultured Alistipes sp. TaxID=538949 RepID=UPI0025CBC90D|nr:Rep family protein [uncultured Alistipes sp.]